jgi:hypothetical protein
MQICACGAGSSKQKLRNWAVTTGGNLLLSLLSLLCSVCFACDSGAISHDEVGRGTLVEVEVFLGYYVTNLQVPYVQAPSRWRSGIINGCENRNRFINRFQDSSFVGE